LVAAARAPSGIRALEAAAVRAVPVVAADKAADFIVAGQVDREALEAAQVRALAARELALVSEVAAELAVQQAPAVSAVG
jgi:hypothetical protein